MPSSSRLSFLFALTCLSGCIGQAAMAQDRSRQSDEDACRPDVFRLCASKTPDEDGIVACLNAKTASLSPACRAVISPETNPTKRRAGTH